MLTQIILTVGSLLTLYIIHNIYVFIHVHFLHRSTLSNYNHSAQPSWALITGASDGIGRGFAEELLNRGFNVVIHGRNPTKLEGVKAELLKQWPRQEVRILVADAAAKLEDEVVLNALKALGEKLTVLINNVGGSGPVKRTWVALHQRTAEDVDAYVDINARFTAQITRVVLPILIRNQPGLVLSVGSVTAELPSPYLSVYSGGKAFVISWARSLKAEMAAEKVRIEVLAVNVGQTQNQGFKETGFFTPTSRRMAGACLDKVGCGKDLVFAYWPHEVQLVGIRALPAWAREMLLVGVSTGRKAEEEKKEL